ncbi:MAG: amino acid permease, partial [Planctomycetes bacterium]|nr:amino acid permease [Planctomycetota bacterium]
MRLIAAGACIFFGILNTVSVKGVGRIQIFLVFALLVILIAYVAKGFGAIDSTRYSPFVTHDMKSVFAVAGMVFISFGGLTKVIDISEEVHNSKRNLPLGMFSAFIVVNLLYLFVVFVTVGIVEPGRLAGSLMPISLGGEIAMGKLGGVLISIAAFLAFATTANAGILSSSRTPMAMSADGLLPGFLARTGKKFHTPYFSLAVTCGFMLIVILTLSI